MPLYEYECSKCGHQTTQLVRMKDRDAVRFCLQPMVNSMGDGDTWEEPCYGQFFAIMSVPGFRADHTLIDP